MKIIRKIILGMLFISMMGSISCMSRKVIMMPDIMKESLVDFEFVGDIGVNMNYNDVKTTLIQGDYTFEKFEQFGAELNDDNFTFSYLYRSHYDIKRTEEGEMIEVENREDLGKQVIVLGTKAIKTFEEMQMYYKRKGRIYKIDATSYYWISDEDYNVLIQRYIEAISEIYGEPDREYLSNPQRNDYQRAVIWEIEDSKTFLAKKPIRFTLAYYDTDARAKYGKSEEERGKMIALILVL